jgi:hypothetical protein
LGANLRDLEKIVHGKSGNLRVIEDGKSWPDPGLSCPLSDDYFPSSSSTKAPKWRRRDSSGWFLISALRCGTGEKDKWGEHALSVELGGTRKVTGLDMRRKRRKTDVKLSPDATIDGRNAIKSTMQTCAWNKTHFQPGSRRIQPT